MKYDILNSKLKNITITPTDDSIKFQYYAGLASGFDEGWYCGNEIGGIVSTYINHKFEEYNQEILWIKHARDVITPEYSFAPLIFQCKNTVFAVNYIEYVNGEKIIDDPCPEEPDFVTTSISNNFIPCLIEVFSELTPSSSKTYVKSTTKLQLIDARTMKKIDPIAVASDKPTLMSEHEQFYIAVKTIYYALQEKGFYIESLNIINHFDCYPNISFRDNEGKICQVYVRYTNNFKDLEYSKLDKFLSTVYPNEYFQQYIAPVFISGTDGQAYRNQPLNISFFKDVIIKLCDIE